MSRRNAAFWLLIAAAGYVLFLALFPRFSNAGRWNVSLSPAASVAAAADAASRFGVDVRGWKAEPEVRVERDLMRHLGATGSKELHRGVASYVAFRDPASRRMVGVRLDAYGRPTMVVMKGGDAQEPAAIPSNATAIADAAFRAFVPDHASYRRTGQEPFAGGVIFRWEATASHANLARRAALVLTGRKVTEIRHGEEVRQKSESSADRVDNVRDIAGIFAILLGLVLYLIGSVQRAIPQRLALITGAIVYVLILAGVLAEMDPTLAGMFGPSPGQPRWVLALGIIFFALPAGLALTGGYPSLARARARQLPPWEALLLRGRLRSASVGASILIGLAAGGWAAAVPHLVRATGLFGDYFVSDGVVDALHLSGLVPARIFGSFLLATAAFGVCVPFIFARLRRQFAAPLAFLAALVLLARPQDPLAAAIAGSALVTLLFFILFERRDLLAVVVAATSAAWAIGAASRLVQSADAIRHEGTVALALLAGVALLAAGIAVFGSKAPHVAWQPPAARAERKRMQQEFAVARLAQERMLPESAPQLRDIEIASYCQPARQVGGDLYDFVAMPGGRVGIAVADVSGKGVPAALIMTITKGLLLAASDGESDPRRIVGDVNAGIHSLRNKSSFVTMIFGVIDATRRTFEFVRAGHTALLWRRADGSVESIAPRGIGLGMSASRTFRALCETRTIAPAKDDFVLLYSDGVTEAMNERSEEFGDERLIETLRNNVTSEMSADDARDAIIGEVALFCDTAPVHDDMTLVVVKW